jgi:hypothetical protein
MQTGGRFVMQIGGLFDANTQLQIAEGCGSFSQKAVYWQDRRIIMKISILVNRISAILISPYTGARAGMKDAYARPEASNWKQFILNDVHAYFSPLTGAINGIRNELKKKY